MQHTWTAAVVFQFRTQPAGGHAQHVPGGHVLVAPDLFQQRPGGHHHIRTGHERTQQAELRRAQVEALTSPCDLMGHRVEHE